MLTWAEGLALAMHAAEAEGQGGYPAETERAAARGGRPLGGTRRTEAAAAAEAAAVPPSLPQLHAASEPSSDLAWLTAAKPPPVRGRTLPPAPPGAAAAPSRVAPREAAAAAGRAEAARLRMWLAGPRAASAVVVMLLCRHAAGVQRALHLAAASLRLAQWPALLALACRVDRAGALRGGGPSGAGASRLVLEAMLAAWPADVCFRLLRRQPSLAEALSPEGFALLLQAVRRRGS